MPRFVRSFAALPVAALALFSAALTPGYAAGPAPSPVTPALVASAVKEGTVTF